MAALTKGRTTPQRQGDFREEALSNVQVFTGGILMRLANGYLTKGATATGSVGVGVSYDDVDNSGGSAGDLRVRYRPGCFRFANSAGADEITIAEIGDVAYIVDDQTVAKTNGSSSRSPAGIIEDLDAQGVWVRFDEPLTKALIS